MMTGFVVGKFRRPPRPFLTAAEWYCVVMGIMIGVAFATFMIATVIGVLLAVMCEHLIPSFALMLNLADWPMVIAYVMGIGIVLVRY